jgi:hypothetical protein
MGMFYTIRSRGLGFIASLSKNYIKKKQGGGKKEEK